MFEPFRAGGNMANLVAQDTLEDAHGRSVVGRGKAFDRRRRRVESARLDYHRHYREAMREQTQPRAAARAA